MSPQLSQSQSPFLSLFNLPSSEILYRFAESIWLFYSLLFPPSFRCSYLRVLIALVWPCRFAGKSADYYYDHRFATYGIPLQSLSPSLVRLFILECQLEWTSVREVIFKILFFSGSDVVIMKL